MREGWDDFARLVDTLHGQTELGWPRCFEITLLDWDAGGGEEEKKKKKTKTKDGGHWGEGVERLVTLFTGCTYFPVPLFPLFWSVTAFACAILCGYICVFYISLATSSDDLHTDFIQG